MSASKMMCWGGCYRMLPWPASFPSRLYAICTECTARREAERAVLGQQRGRGMLRRRRRR